MANFFIDSPSNHLLSFKVMYKGGTNDTSEGSLFSSDNAIEFYEGVGLDGSLFSSWTRYSPRVFRGSIIYDVINASPTTCGNNICEENETSSSCPSDCQNLSLETTDVAAKGAAGAMFNVKALRDMNITSLDFFGASANTNLVQVYTRSGTYEGHERSRDGWEVIFDNSAVVIQGRSDATPLDFNTEVHISENTVQSFYIYSPTKVMYRGGTSDTSEGKLFSSNSAIEFFEGIGMYCLSCLTILQSTSFAHTTPLISTGVDGFFSGNNANIYSPRIWRGTIRYEDEINQG